MEKEERYRHIGMILHTTPLIESRIGRTLFEKLGKIIDGEKEKITKMQCLALVLLIHREDCHMEKTNMTDMASCLHVSAQQATKIMDGLIVSGLVQRHHNPENRRVILLKTTEEGRKYMGLIYRKTLPVIDEAFADISDDQLIRLHECFNTINSILMKKESL